MHLTVCFILTAWLATGWGCLGQTNQPANPPVRLFSVPALQLREEKLSAASTSTAAAQVNSFTTEPGVPFRSPILEKYEAWLVQSWVAAPRLRTSQGGFLDKFFPEPQVIRMKHVGIGGSLVNMIKQRNPFCLLNPVVLEIDF